MSMTQVVADTVKAFRRDVLDCVAAGVVDMSMGMLLAVDTTDSHPGEVGDLLGAATLDLFQGRDVIIIKGAFKQHRGVSDGRHHFQEILVDSDNLVHLFLRSEGQSDIDAAAMCRKVNVGMLFAQAHLMMKQLHSLN